ncbi:hypothetical protein CDL15_Pgr011855 [Punica granatum]|uniref:Uncharacterized protein n=1 Tax=Punica granatum TaxID=22663 RepID=A0A218XE03_PUNGR|nr:hypothetical protein CDL15_Pgr011855 [Punica granatum]PKI58672.1 hypothetical protein CRG98_020938 [Punica granatum]
MARRGGFRLPTSKDSWRPAGGWLARRKGPTYLASTWNQLGVGVKPHPRLGTSGRRSYRGAEGVRLFPRMSKLRDPKINQAAVFSSSMSCGFL